MNEASIQVIAIIASNLIIMLTIFGISVSLHNGLKEDVRAIHNEMKDFHSKLALQDKDFHAKLALQDQEFKMRLCAIEERRK